MTTVELPRIPRQVPDWHAQGACQLFPELDWVEAKGPAALACRVVCAACPVRARCATEALERGEPWGMWGGLDRRDRKAIALEYGFPLPAVLPEHGTNSRYAKHECRCPECTTAHAVYEADRRATAREKAKRRNLWLDPPVVEQRRRVGRRWVEAGQYMLPLPGIVQIAERRTTPSRPYLRLVA
ncbi:WhiB family transcriptional regulator [Prauserella cavernicola]|uniref:WhiB family transcriptional regulator n=1 Tax=Prauserella cavernicola TaxID=2800127 RepID=A0A934R0S6_9PSEU|nr:WhiB family transcriptional regulator [Prauserella cavernicola]MBK1788804.1 WhiB family transcriptional regulator [Prauserella cavernicola]